MICNSESVTNNVNCDHNFCTGQWSGWRIESHVSC